MKKWLFCACLVIVVGCFPKFGKTEERVTISIGEYPPFLSQELTHYGLWGRICTEAFAEMGVSVEYAFLPWKRAYVLAERGKHDGTLGWLYSEEREKSFDYSKPVGTTDYVFFHRKDYDFDWNSLDDLNGLKVGATLEYTYTPKFIEASKTGSFTLEWVSSDLINLKKILGKRTKIFPVDSNTGLYLIQKHFTSKEAEQFTYHSKPLKVASVFLLSSRKVNKSRKIIQLFNQGLDRLHKNGKFQQYVGESQEGKYIKQ